MALRQTFRQVTLVASNFSGWNWNVTWGWRFEDKYPSSSNLMEVENGCSSNLSFLSSRLIFHVHDYGRKGNILTRAGFFIFFWGEWVWRNQFKWFLKMRVVPSKHHVKTSSSPGLLEHFRCALQFSWENLLQFCVCVCVYIWIESCIYFTTCHIKPFIVGVLYLTLLVSFYG